jgi:hypothetical protein
MLLDAEAKLDVRPQQACFGRGPRASRRQRRSRRHRYLNRQASLSSRHLSRVAPVVTVLDLRPPPLSRSIRLIGPLRDDSLQPPLAHLVEEEQTIVVPGAVDQAGPENLSDSSSWRCPDWAGHGVPAVELEHFKHDVGDPDVPFALEDAPASRRPQPLSPCGPKPGLGRNGLAQARTARPHELCIAPSSAGGPLWWAR